MCSSKGAILLSIESEEKREELAKLVKNKGRKKLNEFWTSGNDVEEEGRWEWTRRRGEVGVFGWGEEPTLSIEENCLVWVVEMRAGRISNLWHGASCCNNFDYICEREK